MTKNYYFFIFSLADLAENSSKKIAEVNNQIVESVMESGKYNVIIKMNTFFLIVILSKSLIK